MKVLRALTYNMSPNEWLTPTEIAAKAGILTSSVGSAIRRLRVEGFNIKRAKRSGRVQEYFLFPSDAI